MADNLARKQEVESNKSINYQVEEKITLDPHQVRWSGLEKILMVLGSAIVLVLMTCVISTSISAASAQHELDDVQQTITTKENEVTDLQQDIGALKSSTRMNKIAGTKGLTLIEKNIRTVH